MIILISTRNTYKKYIHSETCQKSHALLQITLMDQDERQLKPELEHLLASDNLNAVLNILIKTATAFAKQKAELRYLKILKTEFTKFLTTHTTRPLIRIIYVCDKLLKDMPSYKQPLAKIIE